MRFFVQGCGRHRCIEVQTSSSDVFLVEAICRHHPTLKGFPWDRVWLCYEGQSLDFASKRLQELPLREGSTVHVTAKLVGGGGDGGSTGAESRDAFLEMYKIPKADKVDAHEEKLAKWTCCQLSGNKLTPPCVCDELGTLFNKDAVIRALIDKTMPESLSHITSLKHVISLKLTPKPSSRQEDASVKDAGNYQMVRGTEVQFHCPLTDLEMNGAFRFSVHVKTGHVVSDRAIKDAPRAIAEILEMEAKPEDWLPLNGSADVVKILKDKLMTKRRVSKKSKKRHLTLSDSKHPKKKRTAVDYAPEEASKQIYASIFSSESGQGDETFLCRSVGARGMNLT